MLMMSTGTLKACQGKYLKCIDTHKDFFSFLVGSIVAVQHEDDGPWTHGVVEEVNSTDHHGHLHHQSNNNWQSDYLQD